MAAQTSVSLPKARTRRSGPKRNWFKEIFAVVAAFIFVLPVIWVVLSSFKPGGELFSFPPTALPIEPTLENYKTAFNTGNFLRYTLNTLFVAVMSVVIALFSNSMAAFALAKFKFMGRDLIFLLTLATLMVPLQVIMVPIFLVLRNLGLTDSLWGIIIPTVASPTGVFLLRQYMMSIPDEILESARIDGATDWTIYWKIILPLSIPALATLGIFIFTWRWNDFIWPFIVLTSESKSTLQLGLARLNGSAGIEWSTLLAATVITMLPILIVFLLLQRYFLSNSVAGSVKG